MPESETVVEEGRTRRRAIFTDTPAQMPGGDTDSSAGESDDEDDDTEGMPRRDSANGSMVGLSGLN